MIYMNLAGVGLRGTHADVLQVAIDSQGRSTVYKWPTSRRKPSPAPSGGLQEPISSSSQSTRVDAVHQCGNSNGEAPCVLFHRFVSPHAL